MGALDKLNARVKKEESTIDDEKQTNDIEAEKKVNNQKSETKKTRPKREVEKKTALKTKAVKKPAGKHPGGRTNTRGMNGKDYRMVNIAIPIDVYEKIKEISPAGNMTYYINMVLKQSVDM